MIQPTNSNDAPLSYRQWLYHTMRFPAIIMLLAVVVLGFTVHEARGVFASDELSELMKQQDELNIDKAELNGKVNWAIATENELNLELRNLDWEIFATQQEIERLSYDIQALGERIEDVQARIAETESYTDEMDELAKERIRALYKSSSISYIEVLFESTSYSDFIQSLDQLTLLLKRDLQMLTELHSAREVQETLRNQLSGDLNQQVYMQNSHEHEAQQLSAAQYEKENLVLNIADQREGWEAALQEIEARAYYYEEVIRAWQQANRGLAFGTGEYIWPLPGWYEITSHFGWREDPFGGDVANNHSGMDIAAQSGTDILAVDSGIVIMAEEGYNGGYGTMIMVDHGNGITTIYGHCSAYFVSEGQQVAQGEVIGLVGSTGWSTGPHLHMEFRLDGVRVDPFSYLYGD